MVVVVGAEAKKEEEEEQEEEQEEEEEEGVACRMFDDSTRCWLDSGLAEKFFRESIGCYSTRLAVDAAVDVAF